MATARPIPESAPVIKAILSCNLPEPLYSETSSIGLGSIKVSNPGERSWCWGGNEVGNWRSDISDSFVRAS